MKKIFMTGATGFVGTLVAQELVANGYQVSGLARSDRSAAKLQKMGVKPVAGSLSDLEVLKSAAQDADAVIHLGFNNDFRHFYRAGNQDVAAIKALGQGVQGTTKPLIVTDGTSGARRRVLTEQVQLSAIGGLMPRRSEYTARKLIGQGINAFVVRLSPAVHGKGDHGFTKMLIDAAKENKAAKYLRLGNHNWSAVHQIDAAHLYVLAVQYGLRTSQPSLRIFNAAGEASVSQAAIARAIATKLNVPVKPTANLFGLGNLAVLNLLNCPADSSATQKVLDWHPSQAGLCADIMEEY